MGLVDKLLNSQSTSIQTGKVIKSNGRGGFGGGSTNRHSTGMNSFNGKNGMDHFSRALNGNITLNGTSEIRTYEDADVEFDED